MYIHIYIYICIYKPFSELQGARAAIGALREGTL